VAALLIPIVVSAADADTRVYVSPTGSSDWPVTIGGEGRVEPIFQGSKRDVLLPFPILAVRRFGTPEPFRAQLVAEMLNRHIASISSHVL